MKIEFRNKKLSKYAYVIDKEDHNTKHTLIINDRKGKLSLELQDSHGNINPLPTRYCMRTTIEVAAGYRPDCTLFFCHRGDESHLFIRIEKNGAFKIFSLNDAQFNISTITTNPDPSVLRNVWKDAESIEQLIEMAKGIEKDFIKLNELKKQRTFLIGSTAKMRTNIKQVNNDNPIIYSAVKPRQMSNQFKDIKSTVFSKSTSHVSKEKSTKTEKSSLKKKNK